MVPFAVPVDYLIRVSSRRIEPVVVELVESSPRMERRLIRDLEVSMNKQIVPGGFLRDSPSRTCMLDSLAHPLASFIGFVVKKGHLEDKVSRAQQLLTDSKL